MSPKPEQPAPGAQGEGTLLSHLFELRNRLLRMVLAILVVFLALFPFANQIYTALADPLMVHLPEGSSMIAIEVAAPFLIPFKLVLLLAVVLTIPYLLYQLWGFVAPGLYKHEKRLAAPLVISSTLLFYTGMAFAYFVVFPLIFAFFTSTAPEGVAVMTDIARYLDFVIMLFLAFGIAFEMPIATILLVSLGVTTPEKLAQKRPYVIIGVFVIGMVLTPPDIISQTLLALPMWLLFEIGLLLSRIMQRRRAREAAETGESEAQYDDAEWSQEDIDEGVSRPKPRPNPLRERHAAAKAAAAASAAGSGSAKSDSATGDDEYRPLSDAEMDAELDRLADEEARGWQAPEDDKKGEGEQKDSDQGDQDKPRA
ncbi:Sec-independent protein translocase, TatC subunit [Thioalkalivibrio sulfidiphilus HL-EbGr7]|uniref:Sec-independent protein translocase protein TatC n=1 Tax=Thioalkalivibrio sulfidiphilus (strain HL-EbGR7) TaxID=396588 RepID=B8GU37_THISH|nr:twin-arginine translocase subunit TatC [Thioalkalivibrio sulfidiphilus]ACL71320.1 Sec-independent protein translocase, TatC subunit [Thioalkalivibrio sulfidiphilus HL-EbGr7]